MGQRTMKDSTRRVTPTGLFGRKRATRIVIEDIDNKYTDVSWKARKPPNGRMNTPGLFDEEKTDDQRARTAEHGDPRSIASVTWRPMISHNTLGHCRNKCAISPGCASAYCTFVLTALAILLTLIARVSVSYTHLRAHETDS